MSGPVINSAGNMNKQKRLAEECPLEECSMLNRLTYIWVSKFLWLTYRKKQSLPEGEENVEVADADVFQAPGQQRAGFVTKRFTELFEAHRGPGRWRKSGYDFLKGFFVVSCSLEVFSVTLLTFVPLLAGYFINLLPSLDTLPWWYAYSIGVGFFGILVLRSLASNAHIQRTYEGVTAYELGLIGAIQAKSLRLSAGSRQKFGGGVGINLIGVDPLRIFTMAGLIPYVIAGPYQFVLTVVMLALSVGWSVVAGILILFLCFPIQFLMAKYISRFRKQLNRLSDERLKLAQETLAGIRLIKYFAWESVFAARIQKVREAELGRVRLILLMTAISNGLVYWLPVFGGAAIVAVHAWRLDGQIDSGLVYSIIMMMSNLVTPIYMVPAFSAALVAAKAASRRLEEYFEAAEAKPLPSDDSGNAVQMADAEFVWETLPPSELGKKKRHKKKNPACADPTQTTMTCSSPFARIGPFNVSIPHGSFTVVVGPVGSGKSSFLAALTGEMKHASGSAALNAESIAYCPQQAWIMSGTVKENILFGHEYDAKRYAQALRESCLGPDMALLAHGDATKLGEGGAGLSGGQKQRLSLARALYAAPQLYLLDDPLSAVDPHVAKKLLHGCIIGGMMKGCTRILVTHHVGLLSDLPGGAVDRLLVMDECKVAYFGPFNKSKLSAMAIEGHANSPDSPPPSGLVVEADPELASTPVADTSAPKEDETKSTGVLPFYSGKNKAWLYLTAAGLLWSLILVGGLLVSVELVRIARDLYFRAHVLSSTTETGSALHRTMLVYTGLGLLQGLLTCTTGIAYGCVASVRAVRKMHNAALLSIMQASVAFFDQVQLGGLLERFGGDLMTVDTVLPERALQVLAVIGSIGSAVALLAIGIVMSSSNFAALAQFLGILALGLLPIIAVIIWSWYMFTNGWSPIQQIIGRNAGALTAAFTEGLSGLPTLRAFNARPLFEKRGEARIDALGKCLILAVAMRRWVSTRIDFASGLLVLLTMSMAINRRLDPGLAGLLLAYALQAAYILEWCIKQIAEVESSLNAFDRIASLALTLEPEATLSTSSMTVVEPPAAWPASGSIDISDLFLRYRPELPLTLKGLSLSIESGQKVALVGRTGAGKSSLIAALYRIARPDAGSIAIDNIDIATVPLATLRHRLAIVPQDPVLFSGTLRFNLDPEAAYSDAQLWAVLEATRMAKDIGAHPLRLEAPVDEAGANFSIGQRQLLCLARALLRPAPVLLIDEATANVDFETDSRIQAVLRQHVRDTGTTLVTVAHRIATVMDYDRVAVLGDGQLLEFGPPHELLAKPNSAFRAMAIKAGITI